MGRPKAEIDWDKVDEMLRAHCEGSAIASLFGIHPDTLYLKVSAKYNMTFSAYAQQKRGEGVSLMEAGIYRDAMKKGGADRMFWLKNKAGWKDKVETDLNIKEIPKLPDIYIVHDQAECK